MTASAVSAQRRRRSLRIGVPVVILVAIAVAALSLPPYLTGDPDRSRIPINADFGSHLLWVSLHAVPGSLALLLGGFNFIGRVRRDHPALHRNLGRVYLLCVLAGSIIAVPAALMSTSGLAAQFAFLLLAVAWAYSGFMAYRAARQHQFQLHRVWMIRNYALTWAAVGLRVLLGIGLAAQSTWWPGLDFERIYTASVWGGVLIPYLVAEWFIVQRALPGSLSRPASDPTARSLATTTS